MKFLLSFFILIVLLVPDLSSQELTSPWSFGISAIKSEYRGDLGDNLFDWSNSQYFGVGLHVRNYVSPAIDMGLDLSISDHGYWEGSKSNFLSKQYQGSLQVVYKLNNGILLREQAVIAPYMLVGIGYTFYKSDPTRGSNEMTLNIPLGLGLKIKMGRSVSLFMQSTYNLTNSDMTDMMAGDVNANNLVKGNDHFLNHQLGFVFSFGNRGKKMDSDGDGFSDHDDACPKVSGIAAMQGCPDTDLDGITDSEDPCPNQNGSMLMGGCPDTDQDGIADHEDECPVNAGPIALRGCPDSDNDGVTDAFDLCPFFPGSLSNKGCPKIEPQTRALLKKANKEVVFESGSSRFKESSIVVLQELLAVLKQHAYYELIIESYIFDELKVDDQESERSQDRANVVKEFLVTNGIESDRLITAGYSARKSDDNEGTELKNKMIERLEFKINF